MRTGRDQRSLSGVCLIPGVFEQKQNRILPFVSFLTLQSRKNHTLYSYILRLSYLAAAMKILPPIRPKLMAKGGQ